MSFLNIVFRAISIRTIAPKIIEEIAEGTFAARCIESDPTCNVAIPIAAKLHQMDCFLPTVPR